MIAKPVHEACLRLNLRIAALALWSPTPPSPLPCPCPFPLSASPPPLLPPKGTMTAQAFGRAWKSLPPLEQSSPEYEEPAGSVMRARSRAASSATKIELRGRARPTLVWRSLTIAFVRGLRDTRSQPLSLQYLRLAGLTDVHLRQTPEKTQAVCSPPSSRSGPRRRSRGNSPAETAAFRCSARGGVRHRARAPCPRHPFMMYHSMYMYVCIYIYI